RTFERHCAVEDEIKAIRRIAFTKNDFVCGELLEHCHVGQQREIPRSEILEESMLSNRCRQRFLGFSRFHIQPFKRFPRSNPFCFAPSVRYGKECATASVRIADSPLGAWRNKSARGGFALPPPPIPSAVEHTARCPAHSAHNRSPPETDSESPRAAVERSAGYWTRFSQSALRACSQDSCAPASRHPAWPKSHRHE